MAPVTAGVVAPPMMRSASFSMAAPIVSAPVAMPAYNAQPVLTGNVGEARPISREELRESGRLTEAPPVDTGYAGVGPTLSAYPATTTIAAPIATPTYGGAARFSLPTTYGMSTPRY